MKTINLGFTFLFPALSLTLNPSFCLFSGSFVGVTFTRHSSQPGYVWARTGVVDAGPGVDGGTGPDPTVDSVTVKGRRQL